MENDDITRVRISKAGVPSTLDSRVCELPGRSIDVDIRVFVPRRVAMAKPCRGSSECVGHVFRLVVPRIVDCRPKVLGRGISRATEEIQDSLIAESRHRENVVLQSAIQFVEIALNGCFEAPLAVSCWKSNERMRVGDDRDVQPLAHQRLRSQFR